MFENELQDLRRHKWRVDSATRALFTGDDARTFLHDVGFCLEYAPRTAVLAPTFIGAVVGSDENLPTAKNAFIHPRAKEAAELKQRLLDAKEAFEAPFGEEASLLIAAAEFPYFYALLGERNPKQPPSGGERGEKALQRHVYELIEKHGPIVEKDLRERLGEFVSDVALTRTLHELWSKLRIVRVGEAGAWDLLLRWAPQMVNEGRQIAASEALSALVAKYLETCVAAEQRDAEDFFQHLVPRSKVGEVVKALTGAREFGFMHVAGKSLLRNVPRQSAEEKATERAASTSKPPAVVKRPWQDRKESTAPRPGNQAWRKYGPPVAKRERKALRSDRPEWKPSEGAPTGDQNKREWKPRSEFKPRAGEKREWKPRSEFKTREGGEKREWKPRSEFKKRAGGEKREWKPRGEFKKPEAGEKREWKPRSEFKKRAGGEKREWKPRGEFKKPEAGEKREWKPRGEFKKPEAGEKREWKPRSEFKKRAGGEKREWRPKRPFPKGEGATTGERGAGRPFAKRGPKSGGFKKPFKKGGRPGGFAGKRPRRPS